MDTESTLDKGTESTLDKDTESILDTYLDFYRDRGHQVLPGGTLIPPPGDPVLFTTSGVHPLVRHLETGRHPLGGRLVNVQRCLRTTDLDEVGDDRHYTLFEMLGSWSFGDYSHSQSLRWGYELLTDGFGLSPDRLYVTVFGGTDELGPDEESRRTWTELGVPVELEPENWWSLGETGPCGPDSEIHVWTGDGPPTGTPGTDPRWMELWNHVEMRYRRLPDGSLEPLPRRVVDTGMGLERLVTLLNGVRTGYDTDLFLPWLSTARRLWGVHGRTERVVSDHLRSVVALLGDGVRPGPTGRGYVPRRLIRRVLTRLWRDDDTHSLSELPDELLTDTLRHFRQPLDTPVREVLLDEQRRFGELVRRGRRVLGRYRGRPLGDDDLRYLHETHGLPPEVVTDLYEEVS
jgi:alanyl-tRNA synthetase